MVEKLVKLLSRKNKTYGRRKQNSQAHTTGRFTRLAESGRIIRSYSGILPNCRLTARHLLRCEHLRKLPGEGFQPYRVEPCHTHQIWLWYRLNHDPDKLYLLFRGQFDFSMPDQESDMIAGQVTDFIAHLLVNSDQYKNELFRHEGSDKFWLMAVQRKLTVLSTKK